MEMSERRKNCFFEKKQQKTFENFYTGVRVVRRRRFAKVFCGAFLQKSDRFLFLA
jgi:hypothetical protein